MSQNRTVLAQHLWLPSNRSLCDLAARQVVKTEEEAQAFIERHRKAPACRACVVVADTLARSARGLTERADGKFDQSDEKAYAALSGTVWPWVISSFDGGSSK